MRPHVQLSSVVHWRAPVTPPKKFALQLEGTRYTTKEVGMRKVGAKVPIPVTPLFTLPEPSSAHRPAMRPSPLALQVLLPLDTHLVATPAKCTPSAPAAVAGAQKVCKLREATVRSPAHELQQASRGGLRSVRIKFAH